MPNRTDPSMQTLDGQVRFFVVVDQSSCADPWLRHYG